MARTNTYLDNMQAILNKQVAAAVTDGRIKIDLSLLTFETESLLNGKIRLTIKYAGKFLSAQNLRFAHVEIEKQKWLTAGYNDYIAEKLFLISK